MNGHRERIVYMECGWIWDLLPIIISFAAFFLSAYQFYVERSRNRQEATIHAFDKLEESKAVMFLFEVTKQEIDGLVQWRTAPSYSGTENANKNEKWEMLSKALPLIEHFAVGINKKAYDLGTLNSMAGNMIISTYAACEELIKLKRRGWGKGQNYAEFETMVEDLIAYRKKQGQSTP